MAISAVLVAGAALSGWMITSGRAAAQAQPATMDAPARPMAPPVPLQPTIAQAMLSGVVIVISKASQQMHVFRDGEPWMTSPVSTGKRGHGTPSGVFPILEKQKFHRSNIYSNAPMPFMQRLTMGGIAIHAGHLPGYPASHGCIRLPYAAARSLYGLTRARETTVVILNEPMHSDEQARSLALAIQQPPAPVMLARSAAPLPAPIAPASIAPAPIAPAPVVQPMPVTDVQPVPGPGQTIQLAATLSPQEAEARWTSLVGLHAELGRFGKSVVPAMVGSRRYFRLRAFGPGTFATCARLKSAGVDCFKVL